MSFFGRKDKKTESMERPEVDHAVVDQEAGDKTVGRHTSGSRNCYLQLEQELGSDAEGVVMKLYLENFKRMNELFGLASCEALLEEILDWLEQETGCSVYRNVGVEFIVILRGYTQGRASRLAESVIERFNHGWKVGDTDCLCFAEIGLCSYPGYAANANEMFKCLDLAVSRAAETGSNEYAMYDRKLHAQFQRRQAIARYISTALEHDEIEVRYRPTYNTKEEKFTRAEFYMRMFVKDVGMVGSQEFVPIAEDTGQIRNVEYYALNRAAAMIARLMKEGKEFESIAVQVSPVLLLQEHFADEIARLMEEYQIPAGKLAIEIDEYAMSTAYVSITALMQELSALGVELILNNFGSGYSGISRLLELPVDTLKFERLFMWQLETNPQSEPIVEGLVQIARKMGRRLIAEGVETERQLDALKRFDCVYQQGFYYSPTLPEELLPQVLDTSLEQSRVALDGEREKLRR